jgi:hypothetical protein
VPKCGYIRRAVAAETSPDNPAATVELDLSALPGGAGAFEKAALCCYGDDVEVTPRSSTCQGSSSHGAWTSSWRSRGSACCRAPWPCCAPARASSRSPRSSASRAAPPTPSRWGSATRRCSRRRAVAGVVRQGRHGSAVPPRRPGAGCRRGRRLRGDRAGRGPPRPRWEQGPQRPRRVGRGRASIGRRRAAPSGVPLPPAPRRRELPRLREDVPRPGAPRGGGAGPGHRGGPARRRAGRRRGARRQHRHHPAHRNGLRAATATAAGVEEPEGVSVRSASGLGLFNVNNQQRPAEGGEDGGRACGGAGDGGGFAGVVGLAGAVPREGSHDWVYRVGINRQLLLGSTVSSFADQPSARSPVTESTIERTNTRDVGVRRRRTPARRSRSNGIGELICAVNDRAAFLFSCLTI